MKFDFDTHLFALLRDEPFLASFSLRLDKVRDKNIRTCGVRLNSDTLKYEFFYNPDFMNSLTPREATGVMKHEFYHLILGHVTSRFSKDRQENMKMWNIAADLAKLSDYRIVSLPKKEDPLETFIKEITREESKYIANYLGVDRKFVKSIENLIKGEKIQTRMPFILEIN